MLKEGCFFYIVVAILVLVTVAVVVVIIVVIAVTGYYHHNHIQRLIPNSIEDKKKIITAVLRAEENPYLWYYSKHSALCFSKLLKRDFR